MNRLDMTEGWVAYIDTREGFARMAARIIVGRPMNDDRVQVLNQDGSVTIQDSGLAIPDDSGWDVPQGVVYAIGEAIDKWRGDANHAATEVRVLREWLDVERKRVNDALGVTR